MVERSVIKKHMQDDMQEGNVSDADKVKSVLRVRLMSYTLLHCSFFRPGDQLYHSWVKQCTGKGQSHSPALEPISKSKKPNRFNMLSPIQQQIAQIISNE